MTKEQQNLAWACLPKEARNQIRDIVKTSGMDIHGMFDLVFGGNVTSDTEPEEMLMVERKKVIERYNHFLTREKEEISWQKNIWPAKDVFSKCASEFYSLFNSKCLPDKAEEIADKCIEPVKEHFEKELNLCELLKSLNKGDKLYSRCFGTIKFDCIRDNNTIILRDTQGLIIFYYSNGKHCEHGEVDVYPSRELYEKYPLDAYSAWMEWDEENNKRTPKTWSELCKLGLSKGLYASTGNEIKGVDCDDYSITTCTESPIEKSALALLKIHQLIEISYDGNVTDKEWRNSKIKKWYFVLNKQYSPDDGNEMYDIVYSEDYYAKRLFAFHTNQQAEEFLKYPENVQLLKDYFMIN